MLSMVIDIVTKWT